MMAERLEIAEQKRRFREIIHGRCPCGCAHRLGDRHAQLIDVHHSELVFQGKRGLPGFKPGIGHTL